MRFISRTLRQLLLSVVIGTTLMPIGAMAGFKEGLAAYEKGDYAEALKEWKPLAIKGHAKAQYKLGVMYGDGRGVAQDYKEEARLYGLAAAQGNADAQYSLGLMYANGQGVAQDYKEAARLHGMAAGAVSPTNNISAAQVATSNTNSSNTNSADISRHSGELAALNRAAYGDAMRDMFGSTTNDGIFAMFGTEEQKKEALKPLRNRDPLTTLTSKIDSTAQAARNQIDSADDQNTKVAEAEDGFPARPAKRPGVVSCNTSCVNASCMRTYDNGKKVRFQAQQVFDPFTQQWKFDSGGC